MTPEEQKSQIVIDSPNKGISVVVLIPPSPMPEYPLLWGLSPLDPFWEDYAAGTLEKALLPLADSGASSIVVDLSATTRHRASVYGIVDKVWLRLAERGKSLVLVFSDHSPIRRSGASTSTDDAFESYLRMYGLRAQCPIARTVADGILQASVPPFWRLVTDEEASQLAAIQQRFYALIHERIGHLWEDGQRPEFPDAAQLYRAGVKSGGFAFPFGGLRWEFTRTSNEIILNYRDHARVAGGWGRRYEIRARETHLVEGGLD